MTTVSQDLSVNGWSTVTPTPTPTGPISSLHTFTIFVHNGTLVSISVGTITDMPGAIGPTTFPTWSILTDPPLPTAVLASNKTNGGAIAGGIVGACALLIAAVAAFFCIRFRRRSPRQWRAQPLGRGQDLEGKGDGGEIAGGIKVVPQNPFDDSKTHVSAEDPRKYVSRSEGIFSPLNATIKPLVIRDKHHPTPSDPFADPQASPTRMGRIRSGSSYSARDDIIEMDVNPGSPKREIAAGGYVSYS
jgi:hypothetical protein